MKQAMERIVSVCRSRPVIFPAAGKNQLWKGSGERGGMPVEYCTSQSIHTKGSSETFLLILKRLRVRCCEQSSLDD